MPVDILSKYTQDGLVLAIQKLYMQLWENLNMLVSYKIPFIGNSSLRLSEVFLLLPSLLFPVVTGSASRAERGRTCVRRTEEAAHSLSISVSG